MGKRAWYEEWFNEDYLEVYAHRNLEEAKQHANFIEEVLNLNASERIVDTACGIGRHVYALYSKGYDIIGGDLSEYLIKVGKRNFPTIKDRLYTWDVRNLPLKDNSYQCALNMFTSFGYFKDDSDNIKAIKEITRVIETGGIFLLDYLNRSYVISNLKHRSEKETKNARIVEYRRYSSEAKRLEKEIIIYKKDGTRRVYNESVRAYTVAEIKNMAKEAGLYLQEIYGGLKGEDFNEKISERAVFVFKKGEI